jgi:bacillithiol biosynthesis cysteine-adding enzyme BshC
MLPNALREYVAVPDPATTIADAAPAHRVGVDVRRFGWIRPLAGDYAFNFSHVAPLYAGDPTSPEAWRKAIERAQQHRRDRAGMAEIVAAQQHRRGAPPAARTAGAQLADARSVAVVTGQQAGGFGGPLFTLLKAVTAIQLARRAAAENAVPAVAVFWVDAEDHDWEEVRSCTVLDGEFQPRTVTLAAPEGAGDLPVAALTLDGRIEQTLEELSASLARTDFTDWVLSQLKAAYRPGNGVADAFARWLESLLGPYGLVVFESADPAAKPLVADVFARELRAPGRTAALAAAAGDDLASRGHLPQVVPQPDSLSLFHIDGARRSIRRGGEEFLVGDTPRTAQSLAEEAAAHPGRFSPNVLLRPIVQDTLFPTICYVAGPSELAYLGQLGGIYEQFGIPMPLMYPRATATLIDSAATRFLAKYDLPLEELQQQDEALLNRLLQAQLPPEVEQSLKDADESVRRSMQRVIEAMPSLDPTLAGAASTTLGKMEHDLRGLQTKVIHAAKRRDETLRRQFTRAQSQIFPLGHPQERTLGVIFFLNRYGPALVDRLMEELPLEMGKHWIMTI